MRGRKRSGYRDNRSSKIDSQRSEGRVCIELFLFLLAARSLENSNRSKS